MPRSAHTVEVTVGDDDVVASHASQVRFELLHLHRAVVSAADTTRYRSHQHVLTSSAVLSPTLRVESVECSGKKRRFLLAWTPLAATGRGSSEKLHVLRGSLENNSTAVLGTKLAL